MAGIGVVELLMELVGIASPSMVSNGPVVSYAAGVLRAAGWSVRELAYLDANGAEKVNLVAAPPGQDVMEPAAELAFLCHTDTVPFAADWDAATKPYVADGMLHGCGACDVKGYLACVLAALTEIGPGEFRSGLRVAFTADEEIGCIGAKHLVASGALRPQRLVIGEPTQLHPARAGKGYCLAQVTVTGREAHSALPLSGRSAIVDAARVIVAIEALAAERRGTVNDFFVPGYTTINVGTISGGTAKNVIAGECRFQLEWRPIPGESPDAVPDAVREIVSSMDAELRCEVKVVRQQPGFETVADSDLLQSMEAMLGRAAVAIPFGSEAPVFAGVAQEIIVFGPGDMRTAHSSRECVPLSELDEAVRCIASLMRWERTSPVDR